MKHLLEYGFDPNINDINGENTLLNYCRKTRKLDAMIFLLCKGKHTDPNLQNQDGSTTLGMALREYGRNFLII